MTGMNKSADVVLAMVDPVSISEKYSDLAEIFSKGATNILPANRNQDILLETSNTSPFVCLYNLSLTELELLCDYFLNNFALGFI